MVFLANFYSESINACITQSFREVLMDILKRIEELCVERGWSFYDLARESNISTNTLYSWKNNKTNMTISNLNKLCKAFGITLNAFFCNYELEKEEIELVKTWRHLTSSEKRMVYDVFDILKVKV